jgi:hypothetical protein
MTDLPTHGDVGMTGTVVGAEVLHDGGDGPYGHEPAVLFTVELHTEPMRLVRVTDYQVSATSMFEVVGRSRYWAAT